MKVSASLTTRSHMGCTLWAEGFSQCNPARRGAGRYMVRHTETPGRETRTAAGMRHPPLSVLLHSFERSYSLSYTRSYASTMRSHVKRCSYTRLHASRLTLSSAAAWTAPSTSVTNEAPIHTVDYEFQVRFRSHGNDRRAARRRFDYIHPASVRARARSHSTMTHATKREYAVLVARGLRGMGFVALRGQE
jgi:hypothetical protein